MGFGDDVYQLAMVGINKKKDLIAGLDPLPGHRSKLEDLFFKIETVIKALFSPFNSFTRLSS